MSAITVFGLIVGALLFTGLLLILTGCLLEIIASFKKNH